MASSDTMQTNRKSVMVIGANHSCAHPLTRTLSNRKKFIKTPNTSRESFEARWSRSSWTFTVTSGLSRRRSSRTCQQKQSYARSPFVSDRHRLGKLPNRSTHPCCCCPGKSCLRIANEYLERHFSKVLADDLWNPSKNPCRP